MRFDKAKRNTILVAPKWMNNRNWEKTYVLLERVTCGVVFEARIYCTASGSSVGCRAWLHQGDLWGYGFGKTSGYGYDRIGTAVYKACEVMGIVPEEVEHVPGRFYPSSGIDGLLSTLQTGIEKEFDLSLVNRVFFGD